MPDTSKRFTPKRRDQWLKMLELGATQKEANHTVGVSPHTIGKWLRDGRAGTSPERQQFAERFDAIKPRKPKPSPQSLVVQERQGRLSAEQLEQLLERAALEQLNVTAIRLLLERPWDKKDADESKQPETLLDELRAFRERKRGA